MIFLGFQLSFGFLPTMALKSPSLLAIAEVVALNQALQALKTEARLYRR